MSIDPDRVKRIMEVFEGIFLKKLELSDLWKRTGFKAETELAYCKQKKWVKQDQKAMWSATPKGVDASLEMKKGKDCSEIADP